MARKYKQVWVLGYKWPMAYHQCSRSELYDSFVEVQLDTGLTFMLLLSHEEDHWRLHSRADKEEHHARNSTATTESFFLLHTQVSSS